MTEYETKLMNLRLQAERRTVLPDHDLMLWAHDEIGRLRAALKALVNKHDFSSLDRGIGTALPEDKIWLEARQLATY